MHGATIKVILLLYLRTSAIYYRHRMCMDKHLAKFSLG
jgi:hypothetical protein